jgi:biotin operon repressor
MILLSVVNTHLRDRYSSLDALCDDLEISREALESKLAAIDYHYDAAKNRFL